LEARQVRNCTSDRPIAGSEENARRVASWAARLLDRSPVTDGGPPGPPTTRPGPARRTQPARVAPSCSRAHRDGLWPSGSLPEDGGNDGRPHRTHRPRLGRMTLAYGDQHQGRLIGFLVGGEEYAPLARRLGM